MQAILSRRIKMSGIPRMQWALVASIAEKSEMPKIISFSSKFLQEVCVKGGELNSQNNFEESPSCSYYATPGDAGKVTDIYEEIHNDHPSVQLVIHVLPCQNSDEYNWMRSLCTRMSLIRQGILYDNAISDFEGVDRQMVLTNVAQWISRRANQVATGKNTGDRAFDLRIGKDILPTGNTKVQGNTELINKSTANVLHGNTDGPQSVVSVRVTGLPAGISEYSVAQIFGKLHVAQVVVSSTTARVQFVNKFHAFNAVILYNNFQYDKHRKIGVEALNPELKAQVEAAV